jgi:hypothetical protein
MIMRIVGGDKDAGILELDMFVILRGMGGVEIVRFLLQSGSRTETVRMRKDRCIVVRRSF